MKTRTISCQQLVDNLATYHSNYFNIQIFIYLSSYPTQVDRLEDELVGEQEKFKAITEELDQTFAEMSGY